MHGHSCWRVSRFSSLIVALWHTVLAAYLTNIFYAQCIHSPNNIITSAVAADLASHPSVRGNNKSLGTVTGLINGCGSITASLGLMAVGPLQDSFGWGSVWIYLIGCTTVGTLLMTTKMYDELFPKSPTQELNV